MYQTTMEGIKSFLEQVVTTENGNFVLCSRNHTVEWKQEFYKWPDEQSKILSRIEFLKPEYDLYFSSHLFSQEDASKTNVLPTRTIQADLDNADLKTIKIEPTILIETSPNRFQAYWILDPTITIEVPALEALSKRITYSINDADHTGWPVGHRLRVPDTLNFKYNNGPYNISVVSNTGKFYLPEEIELLPQIHPNVLAIFDNNFIDNTPTLDIGPFELLEKFKTKIPQQVYIDYISKTVASDRSGALWALMCSLFEAGATREQVFWIAKHSPNNKFAIDLRYHADRQLAKDVQSAEKHVKVKPVDAKSIIDQTRIIPHPNTPGGAMYKRRYIADTTIEIMGLAGRFLHATAGLPYFIPNESGRPVALTSHSEHFRALLNIQYGFNAADPEWKHVHTQILDYAVSLPETVVEATLSYYDSVNQVMLVHTGRKEVLKLSPDHPIETILNGNNGVLFPWYDMMAPFEPDFKNPHEDWASAVFGDVHSCSNMQPKQARALLKVWFMFSLFRSGVTQRPILALFGQPSSGKSTIPHSVYALLYSTRLKVQGLTNALNFDTTSAKIPIYCIDNLDTYVGWVLDRLAQAIGDMDIIIRKLWTDADIIRHRRQAMICVTAHNPKFTREDVTGRLLLITMREIESDNIFEETEHINYILTNRNRLWGAVLNDVLKVLKTPKPATSTVKWRIQDFASLGEWIAIALDIQQDFNDGLRAILGSQTDTLLQQEEILVQALKAYITMPDSSEWKNSNSLFNALLTSSGGDQNLFKSHYKSGKVLGQKLKTMQSSLSKLVTIETMVDPTTRVTLWKISGA